VPWVFLKWAGSADDLVGSWAAPAAQRGCRFARSLCGPAVSIHLAPIELEPSVSLPRLEQSALGRHAQVRWALVDDGCEAVHDGTRRHAHSDTLAGGPRDVPFSGCLLSHRPRHAMPTPPLDSRIT